MSSRRLLPAIALAMTPPLASAFVMLDDFTEGSHQATIEWPNRGDEALFANLDLEHCAFGDRFHALNIEANPRHVPVHVSLGGGEMRIFSDPGQNDGLSTAHVLTYGMGSTLVDLSRETEIWVDVEVRNPDNRFADLWSISVRDSQGLSATNDGWLSREGGLIFRKQGFTRQPDWRTITYMTFTQWFSSQGPPHPESYSVNRIYAVPEPCTVFGAGLCLLLGLKRRSSRSPE